MKRRYKVLSLVAILLVVAGSSLALVLSHNSACPAAPPLAAGTPADESNRLPLLRLARGTQARGNCQAIVADDRMIVKVHAASVNPLDWHYMRGEPYLMRAMAGMGKPESIHMGVDFAGTVESVGRTSRGSSPAMKCSAAAGGASGST